MLNTSKECRQQIFVIPKHYKEIENIVREFNAVSRLRDEAMMIRFCLKNMK